MSFKGLLGSLLACNLVGIMMTVLLIKIDAAQRRNNTKFILSFFCDIFITLITKFMNAFEINKIIAAIILVGCLFFGVGKLADFIFYVEKPEKSAYSIQQVAETTTVANTTSSESSGSDDIMALFANVNSAQGKKLFSKCQSCHNIAKGSKAKIGPSLYNIFRKIGSSPDYKYSKALLAYGKSWDVNELNGFLLNPKKWIPNNKMSFAGMKKPEDRAAVILWMNENSDSPLPLQ